MKIKTLLLVLLLSITIGLKASDNTVGVVDFAVGKGEIIKKDKSKTSLKKGTVLYGGETIITLAGANVKVKLGNGSVVKILPNSKVIVNEIKLGADDNNKYSFGVINGGMQSQVNKTGDNGYYRVYTPGMVAGVRGTDFQVSVGQNGKSDLIVTEGAVAVEGDEKKEMVRGGEKAEVTVDEKITKEKAKNDPEKEYNKFQEANKNIDNPENSISTASERLKAIEARNNERIKQLKSKKKLTPAEQAELEYLYQKSVNQSAGLYSLSENIFQKYKNSSLVKKNFYDVQKSLKSIEDQIADMDNFIEEMSKQIEEFTEETSKDIEDIENTFNKKKK